jgi:hypothetical protein
VAKDLGVQNHIIHHTTENGGEEKTTIQKEAQDVINDQIWQMDTTTQGITANIKLITHIAMDHILVMATNIPRANQCV